ncbi:hypothetical protein ACFFJI_08285 [Allobacillus sp. GCM10007491]|uniref:Uncharacterized protein n=1 Tax=Allobacillus saliphilus TaxID=2912308 RepID=A0A941CXW3_9BACI|nr:hypothetical protein [Allobacillus saliphilus]MBR7554615.1 hypothetical protein [Allobacillus saliphilus]
MKVIVYPIEKWFCYYVIDELLKEGYEVYAYSGVKEKDASDQINHQVEQLQLAFGRNAQFHLEEEVKEVAPINHGIFIENLMESDVSRGIYLTNQSSEMNDERIKIISTEYIEISDDAFIQRVVQPNASSKETKKEWLSNDGNGDKIDHDTKIKISAKKLARWMIVHGMKDMIPQQTYLHGTDQSKSIYFLS